LASQTKTSKKKQPAEIKRIREGIFTLGEKFSRELTSYSSPAQFLSIAAQLADYDAQKLARQFKADVRALQRYFRQELGRTPQDWLNEQRIIAAGRLLLEIGEIKEVAHRLGFKQISHFSRQFKEHHGLTPTEYLSLQKHLTLKKVVQR
jgi:AraC-like DNA-binding protein